MFRFIRRSSLVLVAVVGFGLLAVWGAAAATTALSHSASRATRTAAVTATVHVDAKKAKKAKKKVKAATKAKQAKQAKRTAFDIRADSICHANRVTLRRIGGAAKTWSRQQSELNDLVQATDASLTRLAGLTPGRQQRALARSFLSLTRTSIRDFLAAQTRSRSTSESVGTANEVRDTQLAEASGKAAVAAARKAQELGLKVCGSSGAEWL
jgi:hypothetical protein